VAHALLIAREGLTNVDQLSHLEADDPGADRRAPDLPRRLRARHLVRTVVFIGAAGDNLSDALTEHMNTPATLHPHFGRLYFRYAPLEEPDSAQATLIEAFRASHSGAFPAAQMTQPQPVLQSLPRRHLKAV
jgi:hypothetical protein